MNLKRNQNLVAALCGSALALGCHHDAPATQPVGPTVMTPDQPPVADNTPPAGPAVVHPPSTAPAGIDMEFVDAGTRPQDDFYRHLNGKWLDTYEMPADKSRYGAFDKLSDDAEANLHDILETAAKGGKDVDAGGKKLGAFFASYMDEGKLDKTGTRPLAAELAKIDAIKSKTDLASVIAHNQRLFVAAPFNMAVHLDNRDSTKYEIDFGQGGLGLPDRDYYLKADDAKLKAVRDAYEAHITKLMTLAGDPKTAAAAKDIVALETELAKIQWTKVEERDPVKGYNKIQLQDLGASLPGFDWKRYMKDLGIAGKVEYVNISEPSYFAGLSKVIEAVPLPVWKAYFKWQLVHHMAPYLSKPLVDEDFAFTGTVLSGTTANLPRWKRGVKLVERALGDELGKVYVAKYFPAENKAKMEKLVANLLEAYRQDIDHLDWMTPATREQAKAKLAKFTPKIGYPKKWKDYSKLEVRPGDLAGNVLRAGAWRAQFELNKLGTPVDRDEWGMTPQTVNAYYNPEMNEIVFPAAILQPPFFDASADDAANYGGIGGVIGHEISHGFDDQGSQFDGDGNLRNWFTDVDLKNFKAKTHALVEQYNKYAPVPGYNVNGELTLGENIADNAGLAIAYKAYKISLGGQPSPQIGDLTGEQRLYLGWAQVWRGKVREAEAIKRIKTDPHSPPAVRGNAPLANQPGFYEAFGIKPGDKMWVAPEQRVILW